MKKIIVGLFFVISFLSVDILAMNGAPLSWATAAEEEEVEAAREDEQQRRKLNVRKNIELAETDCDYDVDAWHSEYADFKEARKKKFKRDAERKRGRFVKGYLHKGKRDKLIEIYLDDVAEGNNEEESIVDDNEHVSSETVRLLDDRKSEVRDEKNLRNRAHIGREKGRKVKLPRREKTRKPTLVRSETERHQDRIEDRVVALQMTLPTLPCAACFWLAQHMNH